MNRKYTFAVKQSQLLKLVCDELAQYNGKWIPAVILVIDRLCKTASQAMAAHPSCTRLGLWFRGAVEGSRVAIEPTLKVGVANWQPTRFIWGLSVWPSSHTLQCPCTPTSFITTNKHLMPANGMIAIQLWHYNECSWPNMKLLHIHSNFRVLANVTSCIPQLL